MRDADEPDDTPDSSGPEGDGEAERERAGFLLLYALGQTDVVRICGERA